MDSECVSDQVTLSSELEYCPVLNINCKIYINQRRRLGDLVYSSAAFQGLTFNSFTHFQESDSSDDDMSSFIDNHRRYNTYFS